MAGVGVGEGAYGLRYLSETTSSAYWTGSLVAGLVLVAIAVVRLRDLRLVWVAASAVAIITGAFVLVYPRADQILALLS